MSELPDDLNGVYFERTGEMHTAEESAISFNATLVGDTSIDEAKELIAGVHDMDPSDVHLGEEEMRRTAAGRVSVGFRKWNSSWDPDAERAKNADPSLN